MAAAELYKFLLRPWLPRGALARASAGSRTAREVASAYLGRRQEVGPEAGSGRLEREHGAAACASRPYGRPDASRFSVPGAAAQAGSAARPAGRTDGRGPTRPRARPKWAGPGGATPIPGRGARSCSQSCRSLGRTVTERDAGVGGHRAPRGHLESALLRRPAGVTEAFTGLLRLTRVMPASRSCNGLWWAVCIVAAVPGPQSLRHPRWLL